MLIILSSEDESLQARSQLNSGQSPLVPDDLCYELLAHQVNAGHRRAVRNIHERIRAENWPLIYLMPLISGCACQF